MGKKPERKPHMHIHEPSAEYARTKDIPAFFGQPLLKGTFAPIDADRQNSYVDPRPEMLVNDRLREQIRDLQQFLIRDLWTLSGG